METSVIQTLFKDVIDALIKWWKKVWFEAKLTARLKMIEWENQWEAEAERKKRFEPVYEEKPVDDELQTGESRLLGGEMRLAAQWVVEAEKEAEGTDNGRTSGSSDI